MEHKKDIALRILAPLLVYGAIIGGVHFLRNGWAAILGFHLAICLVLTVSGAWRPLLPKLSKGWEPRLGSAAIAVCALAGPAIYLFWPRMHLPDLTMKAAFASIGMEGPSILAFIVYYSTVNPILEELFWRGWYANGCKRPWAVDLLFGGYHIFVVLAFVSALHVGLVFAVLSVVGFAWRQLTGRLGGLLVPAVSHAAADLSIILAAYLLVRGS